MAKRGPTAKQRREERERQRQRQQRITIIVVVVIAVAAIGFLALISNRPAEAPIPEGILERYEGLEQGYTEEGFPRLGPVGPDVVNVVEYSSFTCPGCAQFHDDSFPPLLDRIRTGEINFTFVPLQTGSIANAEGSARAALCAGEQGRFWEMHDVLFDWQTRFGNTAFSSNRLQAGADALNLDRDAFLSCFNSQEITDVLNAAIAEGINSTPSVRVNGVAPDSIALADINAQIDFFIPQTQPQTEETPETEVEATPEVEESPAEATEEAAPAEESTEEAVEEAEATEAPAEEPQPEATEETATESES